MSDFERVVLLVAKLALTFAVWMVGVVLVALWIHSTVNLFMLGWNLIK